jgi:regulator-associated protein of mTOR
MPEPGYVAVDDPLSLEGANRAYRNWRIQAITAHQKHIADLFKDVILEDKGEVFVRPDANRKNKNGVDEAQQARQAAVSNLPQSVTKFEEKILLTINNAVMTSLVMFHAFQDIIAISDESSVSIWSLSNSARIMDIHNKHTVNRAPQKDMVKRITTVEPSLFTPLAEPRITAMQWINESYNSLLMLGSDDGVVKIWRDTSSSDVIAEQLAQVGNTRGSLGNSSTNATGRESSNGRSLAPSNVELATAFTALPDIAETSRGSGLLLSWQQATGTLFAGGNSNTIRVWDLGKEQYVRVFDTGTKVCLTALATTVGAFAPSPLSSPHAHQHSELMTGSNPDIPLAWTFAGFADGSIGVYDERVASSGGRVHHARDHSSWIVSAHMRADAQEVVTSSVRGVVKFWDIRSWRTYKTLEVQKSPLTSMTVHNCAPIIATGSHAQFIKILTFGGEQLGNIIKYHDGFLGQRMGPITSLTFHPHRMMLAASAADCIVSIYATADDTHCHSS